MTEEHAKFFSSPVFPIPPDYKEDQSVDWDNIGMYLEYLQKNRVKTICTTEGTSHFNLLEDDEIATLNMLCASFKGNKILGIPAKSEIHAKKHIDFYAKNLNNKDKDIALMFVFPDRHYDIDTISEYFYSLADYSPFPILVHAKPIKNAMGKDYIQYGDVLMDRLAGHKNIIGIKEESDTYEKCFDMILHFPDELGAILAGGSQKRYYSMIPAMNTDNITFLTGLGSVWPKLDLAVNVYNISDIIEEYEIPFFKAAMGMGWHRGLKYFLNLKGIYSKHTRSPFPENPPPTSWEVVFYEIEDKLK